MRSIPRDTRIVLMSSSHPPHQGSSKGGHTRSRSRPDPSGGAAPPNPTGGAHRMDAGLIAALTSLFAVVTIVTGAGHLSRRPMPGATRSSSPLDEAELILSRRYARGEISFEEYDRMLVILRR